LLDIPDSEPEYLIPGDPFLVEVYRDFFLATAATFRPDLLQSLALKPLAAFLAAENPGRPCLPDPGLALRGESTGPPNPICYPSSYWTLSDASCSAVWEWARTFSLDVDWVVVRALFTLHWWRRDPSCVGQGWVTTRCLDTVRRSYFGLDQGVFNGRDLGWDPTRESSADFRKRIGSGRRDSVRGYINKRKMLAAERGLLQGQRKLADSHFELLARYQLDKTATFVSIADSMPPGKTDPENKPRRVSTAVHRTAELIGLELRKPSRGGRPRGSRNLVSA
jgi:hypothetical protein